MYYGARYDRKSGKWVVYRKDTGKVVGRFDDEGQAKRHLARLKLELPTAREKRHRS